MMTSQNYHTELVNNGAFFLEINLVFECYPLCSGTLITCVIPVARCWGCKNIPGEASGM